MSYFHLSRLGFVAVSRFSGGDCMSLLKRYTLVASIFFGGSLALALAPISVSADDDTTDDDTTVVVNSLGSAKATTQFSIYGASGLTIANNGPTTPGYFQDVGPRFTVTKPTLITQIGGFLSSAHSLNVQIVRSSLSGAPDPSAVIATYTLSHHSAPAAISFESRRIRLPLGPGTYFALFVAQNDEGYLLGGASSPFSYRAGLVPMGICFGQPLTCYASPGEFGAVRILAEPEDN